MMTMTYEDYDQFLKKGIGQLHLQTKSHVDAQWPSLPLSAEPGPVDRRIPPSLTGQR